MKEKRVLALGFFDGVHVGHQALLRQAALRAQALGCPGVALTFDSHPDTLVLGKSPLLLNTLADRKRLLSGVGRMDQVLVLPFDRATMETPWEIFVEELLVRRLGAAYVVCGHDFSFGYRGQGTPGRLRKACARMGVGCDVIERVTIQGETVSSTKIRTLVAAGSMEEAARYLGHPHMLTGKVVHGKGLGHRLGIPTANIALPAEILPPAYGVYASRVRLPDGSWRGAVTNVGVRPTVHDSMGPTVEPWILDFAGDLYGQEIQVEFHRRLRPERRFPSLEALQAEIRKNAQETRAYLEANVE